MNLVGMDKLKRHRAGDVRADGYIFVAYAAAYKNGERWVDPAQWQRIKDYQNKRNAEQRAINRDAVKLSQRNAYLKNRAYYIQKASAWSRNNPEKRSRILTQRKVRLLKNTELLSEEQKCLIDVIYAAAKRVSSCTKILHHVDHRLPIAKGGGNHPTNLQILPAVINLRKGTKTTTPH